MIFMPEFSPPHPLPHSFLWTKHTHYSIFLSFLKFIWWQKVYHPPANCFGIFWLLKGFYLMDFILYWPTKVFLSSYLLIIDLVSSGREDKFKPFYYLSVLQVFEYSHYVPELSPFSQAKNIIPSTVSQVHALQSLTVYIYEYFPNFPRKALTWILVLALPLTSYAFGKVCLNFLISKMMGLDYL